jgi:ApeA N-terminal domain 1
MAISRILFCGSPNAHNDRVRRSNPLRFDCSRQQDERQAELTQQFDPPISRIEITLRVWAGEGFVERTALYNTLSFTALGLHSVLSASLLEQKWLILSTADHNSDTHDLKVLTEADEAFLFFRGTAPSTQITNDGKTYKIVFSTSVGGSWSNTDGDVIRTTDSVSIETPGATLSELMNVAYQVEQFLSLLCVGPFQGERIQLAIGQPALGQFATADLIWSMGRERRSPVLRRMPHQILASIAGHPELATSALSSWFGAPNSRRLARWLIFDSLFEDASSTAKFLAVAQAWEILGRDEVNAAAYDKKQYQKACKAAQEALENHLDASTAQRLYDLLRSSNRKSFGDMLREVISKIPPLAVQALCPDVDGFVTTVVKVRNVLTHMEGKKSLPIETASYLSIFLTYKLIVLFCIYDCVVLGLPLDNLPMMLANNDTARAALRPLPKLRRPGR